MNRKITIRPEEHNENVQKVLYKSKKIHYNVK